MKTIEEVLTALLEGKTLTNLGDFTYIEKNKLIIADGNFIINPESWEILKETK